MFCEPDRTGQRARTGQDRQLCQQSRALEYFQRSRLFYYRILSLAKLSQPERSRVEYLLSIADSISICR